MMHPLQIGIYKKRTLVYMLLLGLCVYQSNAVPEIRINRRKPVQGLSLTLTCVSDVAITSIIAFSIDKSNTGGCTEDGTCTSLVHASRYTVTQNKQQRITTLTIDPVESSADNGTWDCFPDGGHPSAGLQLLQFATVLNWSLMTYSPSLSSLPSSVTPQGIITVNVKTSCATPAAVISWAYPQGISGSPRSSTSFLLCQAGQVTTTSILSLPGNTTSLYNRQISLTVRVEHDSFDPPTYTRSVTTNSVQFPVPVTSVTMITINSDNEKIGQRDGRSLTLTCVTSASFPISTVTWSGLPSGTTPTTREETTSGVLVKTTSSVTFPVSRSDDGDVIQCQASNIAGQTSPQSHRAVVEVWYGPDTNQIQVTKPPSSVAVETRDLIVTCRTLTSMSPEVTFTWDYSDGSAIAGGTTGPLTGAAGNTWSQTRTFQPMRTKTTFRCTVTNTRTAVSATGTLPLDVKWPPGSPSISVFSTPMYSGDQKTILCTVPGGNPLADITWSCYNTSNTGSGSTSPRTSTREGSKTSSLSFLVTKQQNSQQCQCRATWVHGGYDGSATNTFTVYYAPDMPTVSNPGTLCEGKSTSLRCSSSADRGNPPATYYWTRNSVSVHTGGTYTFTPGRDDHQAEIRCAAGNDHTDRTGQSRPQSNNRQLVVYYTPRISISPADTQTRREGESLSLSCSAVSNPGNPGLSWTFNKTPLAGITVQKTNLSRSDHGDYTCTGRVNTGSVCPGGSLQGTRDVSVIVNYAPDIIFEPVDIREGETLTLTCQADGRPASYTFGRFSQYWGDTEVDSLTGTKAGAVYSTVIQSASYLDTGMYECSVDNTVRDRQNVLIQRKKVSVSVRARPKFTTDSPQRTADEIGSITTLSQTFYNSNMNYTNVTWIFRKSQSQISEANQATKINVTLQKNNRAVKVEGFAATFVISNFQEKDIGVYSVTACNIIGCSSSDVNLTAAGPPLVPLEFMILNTTQTSISLRWKPNFPGGPFTQVFILHYRLQGTGNWKTVEYEDAEGFVYADISGLQPGSVYEVKVRAINNRDKSNEGDFADTLEGITMAVPGDSNPSSSLAIGLGIGLGILVILGLVVLVVFWLRKRNTPGNKDKAQESIQQEQRVKGASHNTAYLPDSSSDYDRAEYADLDSFSPQEYEQPILYEIPKDQPQDVSEYSGLQDRQPATYQTVALDTYAIDVTMPKDPAYVDTSQI